MDVDQDFIDQENPVDIDLIIKQEKENKLLDVKMITPKQEVLLFRLIEDPYIYLLDKWIVLDRIKESTLTCKEASAVISLQLGLIAARKVFPEMEVSFCRLKIPNGVII